VEGSLWAAGNGGGVSCHDADLLAAPVGGLGSAELKVGPMTRSCAPPGRQPETRTGWPNTASIGP